MAIQRLRASFAPPRRSVGVAPFVCLRRVTRGSPLISAISRSSPLDGRCTGPGRPLSQSSEPRQPGNSQQETAGDGGATAAGNSNFWSDKKLVRHVATLVGSQIMLNLGVAQVVPVIPIFAQELGLGASGVGVLIAAPSLARLALNLPLGKLADTIGRRPLMQYGTMAASLGAVGTGVCMPYGLVAVLPCRLVIGAGSAASMTGSSAMMADLTDRAPRHRATIMGMQSMVLSGAWVVGPIVGGWLADMYGTRNAFYAAGLGIGLCSLGYSTLPETLPSAKASSISKQAAGAEKGGTFPNTASMLALLRSHNVQALSALSTSAALGQACFMSVVTLHARQVWEAGAADLGLMFSLMGISFISGMPVGSWLCTRLPRKALIVPGLLASHLTFAALAFTGTREAFIGLLCASHLLAACTQPAIGAFTAEVLQPHVRGQAMSIGRMCGDVVGLGGPIALGVLADWSDCTTAILASTALASCCTTTFALRAHSTYKPR
ncbi:hypothetical protein AB1Y20_001387 [Prymnesium parvum]|uniref:Major facilitator superfamily (MFS) profile domain-containing protein n=1 Tax=Prymnesium parvum TaxID=97485 RepID=A0AB34KDJ3_PRYPA